MKLSIGDRIKNTATQVQGTVERIDFDTEIVRLKIEGESGVYPITRKSIDDGFWEFVPPVVARAVPRMPEDVKIYPGCKIPVDAPKNDVNKLLKSREDTHGSFLLVSKVSQDIKEALRWAPKELGTDKREALDMIAVKMARIVIGNSNEKDHWQDIIGYATLILEKLQ